MSFEMFVSRVEASCASNDEPKTFNLMEFNKSIAKIVGTYNYKLMTSKSKVGKRKILVRLIGEVKC